MTIQPGSRISSPAPSLLVSVVTVSSRTLHKACGVTDTAVSLWKRQSATPASQNHFSTAARNIPTQSKGAPWASTQVKPRCEGQGGDSWRDEDTEKHGHAYSGGAALWETLGARRRPWQARLPVAERAPGCGCSWGPETPVLGHPGRGTPPLCSVPSRSVLGAVTADMHPAPPAS